MSQIHLANLKIHKLSQKVRVGKAGRMPGPK